MNDLRIFSYGKSVDSFDVIVVVLVVIAANIANLVLLPIEIVRDVFLEFWRKAFFQPSGCGYQVKCDCICFFLSSFGLINGFFILSFEFDKGVAGCRYCWVSGQYIWRKFHTSV